MQKESRTGLRFVGLMRWIKKKFLKFCEKLELNRDLNIISAWSRRRGNRG